MAAKHEKYQRLIELCHSDRGMIALLRRRGIEPSVSVEDRVVKVVYGAEMELAEGFVR